MKTRPPVVVERDPDNPNRLDVFYEPGILRGMRELVRKLKRRRRRKPRRKRDA